MGLILAGPYIWTTLISIIRKIFQISLKHI